MSTDGGMKNSSAGITRSPPRFRTTISASNATTAGAASFTVHLNNLQTNVPFYVHGLEGFTSTQVVTIRIQAPGFTDGTAVSNIVQPGIDISGLLATGAAAAADDPFQVRWGLPNAQNTGLNSLQALRFGGPGLTVTVTTTQPTFGNIVNTANSPAGATSASPVAQGGGSTTTPISVASGGVAFNFIAPGIAFVIPTAPGFIPMQQSQTLQDGFRVTVTP